MKIHKHYSPDGAEGSAGAAGASGQQGEKGNGGAEPNGFEDLLKQNNPEEWAKQQEAKGGKGAGAEGAEGGKEKGQEGEQGAAGAAGAAEGKKEGEEGKEGEAGKGAPTFKVPVKETFSEIKSFVEMGKQLGIEPKADTAVALKEAFEAKIEGIKAEIIAKQKEEGFRVEQRKHTPKAQQLLEFLNNNGDVDDYVNPVKPFQDLKLLGDEELVRRNLTLQNMKEEDVEAEIAHLITRDRIKLTADNLRKGLDAHIEKTQKSIVENQKTVYTKALAKENTEIKEALSKFNDLHGILIPGEVKNNLTTDEKIKEYRDQFKRDPGLVAKAILLLELGDQAAEIIKTRAYEEGMTKNVQKLHNLDDVPGKIKTGASVPHKEEGLSPAERWKLELEKGKTAKAA